MKVFARVVTYSLFAVIIALALGITWQGGMFWAVMACCAAAGLVILWAEFRKAWAEKSAELDRVLEQGPPALDSSHCQIGDCHEPAWSVYDRHPAGWIYVCRSHDAMVRQWVGPYRSVSIEAPYDQTGDVA